VFGLTSERSNIGRIELSSSRFRRVSLNGIVLIALVAGIIGPIAPAAQAASFIFVPDSGGQNDIDPSALANQSDLSAFGINGTGVANTTTQYGWKWDQPTLSGNNSQDVCVYLSETGDNDPTKAEYAICFDVITNAQGQITSTSVTYWFCPTYNDANASTGGQKCFGNSTQTLPAGVTITATAVFTANVLQQFASDPDLDSQVILDAIASLNLTLVNICSKKSASPSSDSSDCGVERAPAFLKLMKVVQDGSAVPLDWTLSWNGPGSNDGSVAGDNTQFVPVPDGTYSLSESGPSNYELVSLVCSPIAASNSSVTLGQGDFETCTFTNKLSIAPPVIDVTKTANPTSLDEPGGTVTFTVDVENDSSSAATLTVLNDNVYGNLLDPANPNITNNTCANNLPHLLAATDGNPGTGQDFFSCSFDAQVTGNAGSIHTDIVTATATNDAGESTDTDDATVTIDNVAPTVQVDKSANPTHLNEPGGTVTFSVDVKNTSNESVTLTKLVDDVYGDLLDDANNNAISNSTCTDNTQIAAGATYSCSFDGQVSGNAGSTHTDTVTGTVVDDDGTEAEDDGSATVTIDDILPDISVTKTANPTSVLAPGGLVEFTFVVTNNAAEDATITVLTDDKFGTLTGDADCQVGTVLAANGGNCEFKATFNVTGAGGTSHTNVFSATATDDDGNSDTATDDATVTILSPTGRIAPTATTCQDFVGGTAGDLTEILYGLKGNTINNVAPGVLFYYSLVTVPAGTHTIDVQQSTTFIPFAIQQDQAVLYSYPGCVKLTNNSTGIFTGVSGGTYVVGIKYNPGTVVGQPKPGGSGEVVYTFTTRIDGSPVASSADSVTLRKKPNH
jgi:hypothetical protein